MWSVLKFIFSSLISFIQMLFTIQVDNGLSLGLLMCICFILFPIMLRIINFIKQDAVEELNSDFENKRGLFSEKEYTGKHEPVGRHSKEYFRRQKVARRYYTGKHERSR